MGRSETITDDREALKADIEKLNKQKKKLFGTVNVASKVKKLKLELKNLEVQKKLTSEKLIQDYKELEAKLDKAIKLKKDSAQRQVDILTLLVEKLQKRAAEIVESNAQADKDLEKKINESIQITKDCTERQNTVNKSLDDIEKVKKNLEIKEKEIKDYESRVHADFSIIKEAGQKVQREIAALELDKLAWSTQKQKEKEKFKRDFANAEKKFKVKFEELDKGLAELEKSKGEHAKELHQSKEVKKHLQKVESELANKEKLVKEREKDLEFNWKNYEKEKKKLDWKNRERII